MFTVTVLLTTIYANDFSVIDKYAWLYNSPADCEVALKKQYAQNDDRKGMKKFEYVPALGAACLSPKSVEKDGLCYPDGTPR